MRWKPIYDADMGGGGGGGGEDPAPASLMGGTPPAEPAAQNPTPPATDPTPPSEPGPTYQPFTLPEGMSYDDAMANNWGALAGSLKLSQEQAQGLVDAYTSGKMPWLGAAAEEEFRKQQAAEEAKRHEQQGNQCRNHPELGGARLSESLGYARKFIDAFGGDKLRQELIEMKVDNNPAIFEAFVRAGKLLAEDRFVTGSNSGQDTSFSGLAKTMFPNM